MLSHGEVIIRLESEQSGKSDDQYKYNATDITCISIKADD